MAGAVLQTEKQRTVRILDNHGAHQPWTAYFQTPFLQKTKEPLSQLSHLVGSLVGGVFCYTKLNLILNLSIVSYFTVIYKSKFNFI